MAGRMSQGRADAAEVLWFIFLFLPWFGDLASGGAVVDGHHADHRRGRRRGGQCRAMTPIPGVRPAALLGIVALVLVLWLLIFDFPRATTTAPSLLSIVARR